MKVTLPLHTHSGNMGHGREHWGARRARVKRERTATALVLTPWRHHAWGFPLTVTLVRIAPRALDAEDNLTAALKSVRDEVAAQLGVDDRDARVRWLYGQERGAVREYAVRIEVEESREAERERAVVVEMNGMLGCCQGCGVLPEVPHRKVCPTRAEGR